HDRSIARYLAERGVPSRCAATWAYAGARPAEVSFVRAQSPVLPGMERHATRARRPRAVAPRDLAGFICNAGCATTPRALGCRCDGRRCRADARVSHAADRDARP